MFLLGLVVNTSILWTIGIVLLIVGAVLHVLVAVAATTTRDARVMEPGDGPRATGSRHGGR